MSLGGMTTDRRQRPRANDRGQVLESLGTVFVVYIAISYLLTASLRRQFAQAAGRVRNAALIDRQTGSRCDEGPKARVMPADRSTEGFAWQSAALTRRRTEGAGQRCGAKGRRLPAMRCRHGAKGTGCR